MRGYAALFLLLCTSASGASDINQRVQGFYSCLKTGEIDSCFRTYIHWPTMFNMLTPEEKQQRGVSSPSEYREAMMAPWIVDESAVRERELSGYLKSKQYLSLPPQQQAGAREYMETLLDKAVPEMASRARELAELDKAQFANSQYEILSIDVTGNSAFVEATITDPSGDKRNERVRFQQIDGEWWMMDGP